MRDFHASIRRDLQQIPGTETGTYPPVVIRRCDGYRRTPSDSCRLDLLLERKSPDCSVPHHSSSVAHENPAAYARFQSSIVEYQAGVRSILRSTIIFSNAAR